uniref:GmrSD restriction endonucleases N-terminal domain-containing protein n=1 Tax=uncultured bacterium Contig1491 TaxID=1393439 RepID=W0FPF9_9BACT|nr:hypothetical protein [uncultured bacterium Contig1491]
MRIRQQVLLDLLGEPNLRFAIPRFQRSYSWGAEQCDELWRDILRAARAHRSHFVGTLIYCEDEGRLSVVDGQQRLTTVTLLLVALAKHLDETGEQLFGIDGASIVSTYLLEEGGPKIVLSSADASTLEAVVRKSELPEKPSARVLENLANFEGKMRMEGFDAMELLSGLQSLVVISAELDNRAQAPAVFESFNSKGVPLVTADLVRNFLLLAESHDEQARLYAKYWVPICGVFGDDPGSLKLNNAILGWLAVRLKAVRKFGDTQAFSIFKSFCEDEYTGTIDDLLEEMYAFCMVWAENYRYHAVKKYKTADWATLGHKTRVSGRPRAKLDNPESAEYYKKHFGVDPKW